MKTAIVIWTVIAMALMTMIIVVVTKNQNFTGSDITFVTGDVSQFTINAPAPVTIEAASNLFFAFRNGSTTVVGTLTPNPLGWDRNEYFTTGSVSFSGGLWVVEKGNSVTVHLRSSESMTVQDDTQPVQKAANVIGIIFFSIVAWLLGILFVAMAME